EIALGKPLENQEEVNQKLIELKEEHGLSYSVHVPFLYDDLAHPEEGIRKAYVDLARDSIDSAVQLGANHLVVHPGDRFFDRVLPPSEALDPLKIPREAYIRNSLRSLSALSEYALPREVDLLVENLAGGLCDAPEEVERLVSPWPNTSFLLDTGHGNVSGTLYELLELEPQYFHFHDNSGDEDGHLSFGRGTIDIGRLLSKLKNYGEEKNIIIELYSLEDVLNTMNVLKANLAG
ncbi:sugar phosphate isomerase/epimerase, partial [Candidatus Bipolaricaulota bacterium]|nr:sugar phosphate isomerase/epimerase [Candidatus Bipolaricaulota bacterium]